MEINWNNSIDNLNKVVFNNETSQNSNYDYKNGADKLSSIINNDKDYVEFSIDYSNDDVHNILNNIQISFDFVNNMDDNRTVADCADEYGKILKSINSNNKIDDNTKEKITKILDNSFDNFANRKAKYISERFSDFFNGAYIAQEYKEKNQSLNFGITGDKLIDKDMTENNIRNMLTAVKVFYKNNLDGTKEQLDKYLEGKFNKTESIDKLSYNDLKYLEKSGVLNWEFAYYGKAREKAAEMNGSLDNLKKAGVSETVIDTFKKACYQNNDMNKRFQSFGEIRLGYEKRLEMIGNLISSYSEKLKELAEKRKKLIEEHEKQIEKFKKDMLKLSMLKMNRQDKILGELEKAHSKQLENMDKRKVEMENQKDQLLKQFSEIDDSFKNFLKNPADEISGYISDPKNNLI